MRDDECVRFLQWALPELGMRWAGFRRVRRQVCRRISRRMVELGVDEVAGYRDRLGSDPGEWRVLDRLCRVTISRLWRDRALFAGLEASVLPALAEAAVGRGRPVLDLWSCGCASGEEPHSLVLLWRERLQGRFPGLGVRVLASDLDLHLLVRAGRGVYPAASARELPAALAGALEPAEPSRGEVAVAGEVRAPVLRVVHDVRSGAPAATFDLIACRNLVFTYFSDARQTKVGGELVGALRPGGALVIGGHERLPRDLEGLVPWPGVPACFRREGWRGRELG